MSMHVDTLVRWFVRALSTAPATVQQVHLIHRGSDDKNRVCRVYDLQRTDQERIREVCAEVLADAQDETDFAEARCSFVVAMVDQSGQAVTTTRLRCQPSSDDGESVPEDANREGLLAMVMKQNQVLHRELASASVRQRQVYEGLLEIMSNENSTLRQRNEALTAALMESSEGDAADELAAAELAAADAESRDQFFSIVKKIGEHMGVIPTAAADGNGSNGSNSHSEEQAS